MASASVKNSMPKPLTCGFGPHQCGLGLNSATSPWVLGQDERAPGHDWYLTTVLMVQAASWAVSGRPSDHLAPLLVVNVMVRPPSVTCQLLAKSGTTCWPGPY